MVKIKVTGMTCDHCEMFVKKVLSNVVGVTKVSKVSRKREEAIVEGTPDPDALVDAVNQQGYKAELIQ